MHWAIAGAGDRGRHAQTLLFVANQRLGLSTGLEDLCSLVVPTPVLQARQRTHGRVVAAALSRRTRPGRISFGGARAADGIRRGRSAGSIRSSDGVPPARCSGCYEGGAVHRLRHAARRWVHRAVTVSSATRTSSCQVSSQRSAFMAGGILTTQLLYRVVFAVTEPNSSDTPLCHFSDRLRIRAQPVRRRGLRLHFRACFCLKIFSSTESSEQRSC